LEQFGIAVRQVPFELKAVKMEAADFEWDANKEAINVVKHGVSFAVAQQAFADPQRVIAEDLAHSGKEKRYYCFGLVQGGVLTVRFTIRGQKYRIYGAGYWRKGKELYEKTNQIHK
jgi:hypothetical protein